MKVAYITPILAGLVSCSSTQSSHINLLKLQKENLRIERDLHRENANKYRSMMLKTGDDYALATRTIDEYEKSEDERLNAVKINFAKGYKQAKTFPITELEEALNDQVVGFYNIINAKISQYHSSFDPVKKAVLYSQIERETQKYEKLSESQLYEKRNTDVIQKRYNHFNEKLDLFLERERGVNTIIDTFRFDEDISLPEKPKKKKPLVHEQTVLEA